MSWEGRSHRLLRAPGSSAVQRAVSPWAWLPAPCRAGNCCCSFPHSQPSGSTLNGSDQRCTGEHMLILAPIKSKSGSKSTGLIAQSELMASEVIKIPFNLAPIYHTAAFILFVPG